MKITNKIGMLLLGAWLILRGLESLVGFSLGGVLMAVLALAAGIFIVLGK